MKTRATLLDIYLCMYMSVWAVLYVASEGKVSDACHGGGSFDQTYNDLQCDTGSQICITEVRYYQWHNMRDGCPYEITGPVKSECCRHNTSRCSWVRQESDYLKHIQEHCSDTAKCRLHSLNAEKISSPCRDSFISTVSSVRSIHYTCSSNGTCPLPQRNSDSSASVSHRAVTTPLTIQTTSNFTGTTTSTETSTTVQRSPTGTTFIIGGVVGIVLLVVVVAIIVLLWRRARRQRKQQNQSAIDITRRNVHQSNTNSAANNSVSSEGNSTANNAGGSIANYSGHRDTISSDYITMTGHHIHERSADGNQQPQDHLASELNLPRNEESSTPDYYNTANVAGLSTYYNITQDEDHDYLEVPNNEYNRLRFSRMDQNNYDALA